MSANVTASVIDTLIQGFDHQATPGLIYTSVTREFDVQGEWMLLGQALGLLVGAIFWGVGCDVWGRR